MQLRELLPNRDDWQQLSTAPRNDFIAGLSVAVVALPLALAFGIASGVGAAAGMASAIVAGIVASIFGGCRVQVTGPSGAMTVVLIPIVATYGPQSVFAVGLLAGIFLLLLAFTGAARIFRYIPLSVVEGFTLGIALLIGIQQIPMAFGMKSHSHSVISSAYFTVTHLEQADTTSIVIAAATVIFILSLRFIAPGVPAGIIAVVLATGITWMLSWDIPSVGEIPSQLSWVGLPHFSDIPLTDLIIPALSVAGLAAIEGLLCATVADSMAHLPAHNPHREVFGQGISNVVTPLFGGVPATAVIARTAVNIRSGGISRLSTFSHAVILWALMMFAARIVAHIPLSTLAGVLIATAIRMVEGKRLAEFIRRTPHHVTTVAITAAATLFLDLFEAVALGIVIAGLVSFIQNRRTQAEHEAEITQVEHTIEEILQDEN